MTMLLPSDPRPGRNEIDSADAGGLLRPDEYRGESIDLYVNSTCNLACKTCFLGDDYFVRGRQMDIEMVESILYWAQRTEITNVAFLGGEPSLHPDIEQLLTLAKQVGVPASRFVTNGSRPFQRLLRSPASQLIDLAYVSLDGPTPIRNDLIRGGGTFAQTTESMTMLSSLGIPFVITTSMVEPSIQEFWETVELAERSACRLLNIHWVSPTGRARNLNLTTAPMVWREICDRVSDYIPSRSGFSIQCEVAYTASILGARARWEPDAHGCAVRDRSNLQFMPDGAVYSCGLLVDRPSFNGYWWNGSDLVWRSGANELSLCAVSTEGCPVRMRLQAESLNDTEYLPVCIYQRVRSA